jgi:single-strand DNA-binding protein
MAGDTLITIVGNLTADPELRYTPQGIAVANFTIASTPRNFDRKSNEWKDGDALFLRGSVWREYAEHIASSLKKGMRVIAQGKLKQRSYETREGEKRTAFELEVEEIGPALRYATAQVTRTTGKSGSDGWAQQGQQSQQSEQRPPWANEQPAQAAPQQQAWPQPVEPAAGEGWASGEYDEEPPF